MGKGVLGRFFSRGIKQFWARSLQAKLGLVLGIAAVALAAGYVYATALGDVTQGTTAPGSHEWRSLDNVEVDLCAYCHLTLSTLSPIHVVATDCLNCHKKPNRGHVTAPATIAPTATATKTPLVTVTPTSG